MNRTLMVFVCVVAMLHVSPSMFARLIEDSDSVQLNAVSSSMKQKRTESQANMQPIQFAIDVNTRASAVQRKLSSDLLVRSVYYHNSITSTPTKAMLNSAIQATANEMVNCEITCEVSDRLLARIVELGGRVVSSSSRFGSIHAFLPLAALEILGKDEAVKRIREAHKPMLNKVNTSEGDISHRAASARSAYNVTGAGIKIGVISDSVRYLSQIQSSGDLPSNVTVLPGLSGIQDDESDIGEGTAMLEIVHDLCPGASLYFATAGVTEAEMAESIIALKNAGCDIIVDDICFRTESAFQDGIISSAVKDVYDSGKIYVTCAANKGNYDSGYSGVWEGDFNPSSQTVTLGGVEYEQHEFPDGSTGNLINYWSANNVYTLQWSDPLGASGNDYELAVYDYDTGTWLQKSSDVQNGDDDPYDWCYITPNMATYAGLGLRVLKKKGAANRFIRIAAFNSPTGSKGRGRLEMSTPGMVYGHNASQYAISVAATEYVANRAFVPTDAIAFYSSDGPRKMFYDITGTSYTTSKLASGGRLFNKPDFAAASTVSCATPDFEEFGGTSAAAPHIAAICGLMLHANQDLTQSEVVNIMSSSTVSPYSGWNRTYGYGMVNAVECVRLAKESASGPSPNLEINIASGTTSGSCTVENDGSSWKIVEAFPSWVKGITFYCPANGNVMSLASNGTSIGFSGEATMTVNCTTNDTGSARTWDMSISNRTTRAIQYRIHVVQSPHVAVSPPSAPTLTGISTYGLYARTDYIEVGWSAAARATSYNVYRNTSSSTSGRTKVASNVTSPYRDYVSNGLTPGVKYWYWVEAVNSAGSTFSVSDWGNILVSALLSKTTLGFTAAGGTSNITVTANTSWSASTSASWLSLSTSGTSGNGSIAVTAAPNANTSSRSGYVIATAGAGTSYPKVVTNVVTQAAGMTLQTALDSTTLSFTSGGGSSWFGQTTITHDGVDAVQSGALGNSQTNWLQTTVTGPGTISFWWYASSEQNWDFLEFMIDGDVVGSMSGTNNVWTSKSFEISTSGTHTLQWRYRKDGSQYRGLDAGFVDQVTWTPSTSPTPTTYTVTYSLDGGTHGATHPTTATYDTAFYVSAPTKSGYTFAGWTVTSGLNTSTAKWGTSSNPSTTISSSSTMCVNGATGNVYFMNLTPTANGSVTLTANWAESSDFTYNIVSGSAVITKYTGSSSTVVIPSTIDGYTVTALADYAFHQSTITSITLPDSLTKMGWFSLAHCTRLTTIHLPANVAQFTSRQYAPFGGNTSQATFTVAPENTHFTAVDGVLFSKDMKELISFPAGKNVESYEVPSSVTNIWGSAFRSCKYLSRVTIPEGVSSLMYCAFSDSSKLASVSLPESLRTIDFYVFQYCASLKSLTIPAGVTTIGFNALNTSSLTNLVLLGRSGGGSYASEKWGASIANANIWVMPDDYDYWTEKLGDGLSVIAAGSSTEFPYKLVNGNAVITNYTGTSGDVIFPAVIDGHPVTEIAANAFYYGTYPFVNVTISEGIQKIGHAAFGYSSVLETFSIPSTLTMLGDSNGFEFISCPKLRRVDVAAGNPNYKSVDGVLYNKAGTTLIYCPASKDPDGDFTVPASVARIEEYAFDCSRFRAVVLPEGLRTIEDNVFWNASRLVSMEIPETVGSIGRWAFCYCSSLADVRLPSSLTAIGQYAFTSTKVGALDVPAGVTSIGQDAFKTTSLTNLILRGRVATTYASNKWGSNIDNSKVWVMRADADYWQTVFGTGFNILDPETPVTALPDLCPYTPVGWSGSLVLSTESQNATNSTATSFSPNDVIYVSLAVVNLGVGFSNDFNWALYVDDSLRTTGANWGSGLAANGYSRWFALPIGPLPPGTHTIKVMYDYAGRLDESDESNNTVTRTVIVSGTVVRPSNDNFAGAATISGMSGSVTGSNVNATRESGEPLPSTSAGATNTIWWTWTAPATGIAQFSTAGSKVSYTAMGAYVGSSVSGLTTVSASADSYSQSSISFSVVSGTRYYIAVSGTGYRYQGTIKLNWSMFTPVPLNTALDNASQTFTTGGAANWVGVSDESYYGGSSARSGAISHSQSTWLQTEVTGEGTLSFWYKVSSESGWDKLIFYVDGVQKTTASGTVGWSRFECVISNNTQHVVKWTYSKDRLGSTGSDCCWVDKVEWTPSGVVVDVGGGETVTVPRTWIEAHRTFVATLGANDEEAVTNGTAANGRKVWECYVLGLDPGDATDDFRIVSFPIKADGTPDLTNIVFEPARGRWNVPDAQVVVKGAATLDGPWDDVPSGGNSTFRFFKVVVELP